MSCHSFMSAHLISVTSPFPHFHGLLSCISRHLQSPQSCFSSLYSLIFRFIPPAHLSVMSFSLTFTFSHHLLLISIMFLYPFILFLLHSLLLTSSFMSPSRHLHVIIKALFVRHFLLAVIFLTLKREKTQN